MTFVEFSQQLYSFVDSIKMVYITAFFALTAIIYENVQKSKLNKECQRLIKRNLELENALSGGKNGK